jgi:TonB family protein
MLVFAGVVHLLLLISLNFQQMPLPSLQKMMKTVLEESLNEEKKSISEIAVNIAPMRNGVIENISATPMSIPPLEPTPTLKRTVSAASHQSKDAAYLTRWQTYVEDYGNNHYPEAALKNNLKGQLRLLVAIKRDGSVHEVTLRQSSGSEILDKAAIEIVLAAAPFEPLPPEIASEVEIFEIIRTWHFIGKLTTLS